MIEGIDGRPSHLPCAVAALSAGVIAFELAHPAHASDLGARGAVGTAMAAAGLAATALAYVRFRRTGRLSELLLLGAACTISLADFTFVMLPTMAHAGGLAIGDRDAARGLCNGWVAAAVLAAALSSRSKKLPSDARIVWSMIGVATTGVMLALLVAVTTNAGTGAHRPGLASAARDPMSLAVALLCAIALLIAAALFWRRRGDRWEPACLSAAAIALAAARLQYLAQPLVHVSWITPADGLRLAAIALLAIASIGPLAQTRRDAADAAMKTARERLARELHDGLAQDLAFIVAHGQRFSSEIGPEHPVSLAARRALAAARGAIVDLTASTAGSTGAALREIARELGARHAVDIDVVVVRDPDSELSESDREQVVLIAREAIVNAVKHGRARKIQIALDIGKRDLRLRVMDDGCGIADVIRPARRGNGLGLPAMRAGAVALGGELTARRMSRGGTELKLVV